MPDLPVTDEATPTAGDPLAAEPEDGQEFDVYIGEPFDPDYLARLSKEKD